MNEMSATAHCICLICFKPKDVWIEFLSKFRSYDVYVIIDDNDGQYADRYKAFSNVRLIQIDNMESDVNGFTNTDFKKNGRGWSKALYYFSSVQLAYKNVWFIEDDVFLYGESTIRNIDNRLASTAADLLTTTYEVNATGKRDYWHWMDFEIKLPPPYYSCMCCAVRMSSRLLSCIKQYANINNTLFFHEAVSPTLCHYHNFNHVVVPELKNIIYMNNYNDDDIDADNLYHPVKDITKHTRWRLLL